MHLGWAPLWPLSPSLQPSCGGQLSLSPVPSTALVATALTMKTMMPITYLEFLLIVALSGSGTSFPLSASGGLSIRLLFASASAPVSASAERRA